ncbi:DKNYY domain-containing protein [Candidatus Parcubacteria bacterium]|nr:DKNYY domain-containing protein [Candidatus Parcubacteria bacterium]MCK4635673.1 DKNYY domain-containing protein [Candidatus Moranbacteria bacterium]
MKDFFRIDKFITFILGSVFILSIIFVFREFTNKKNNFCEGYKSVDEYRQSNLYDGYSKDGRCIFYDDHFVDTDYETFEVDYHGYAKDKNQVYYAGKTIMGADPVIFEKLGRYYSKDNKHVYYLDNLIKGVDINTFEALGNYYSKDKNNIYFENEISKSIDYETFKYLDFDYVKDKNGVYNHGRKIIDADSETFKMLGIENQDIISRDENNCYKNGLVVEMFECEKLTK